MPSRLKYVAHDGLFVWILYSDTNIIDGSRFGMLLLLLGGSDQLGWNRPILGTDCN